jgi:hypothetical protein
MELKSLSDLLPPEIIQRIIDFLNNKDKLKLLLTSKFFKRMVLENIRFERVVRYEDIKKSLYFDNFTNVHYPILKSDMKFPKNIRRLSLLCSDKMSEIIPDDICRRVEEIHIDHARESIKLDKFKALKTLSIDWRGWEEDLEEDLIVPEGVQVFKIFGYFLKSLSEAAYFSFDDTFIEWEHTRVRFLLPDSVKRVVFHGVTKLDVRKNDYSTVESIFFNGINKESYAIEFMKKCTNLKSIEICEAYDNVLQDLPISLTEIKIYYRPDSVTSLDFSKFKCLKSLKIASSTLDHSISIRSLMLPPYLERLNIKRMKIEELHLPDSLKSLCISSVYVEKHMILPEGIEYLEIKRYTNVKIINHELKNLRKLKIIYGVYDNPFICKPFFSKNLKEAHFLCRDFKIRPSLQLDRITTIADCKEEVKKLKAHEKIILCPCYPSYRILKSYFKGDHRVIIKLI